MLGSEPAYFIQLSPVPDLWMTEAAHKGTDKLAHLPFTHTIRNSRRVPLRSRGSCQLHLDRRGRDSVNSNGKSAGVVVIKREARYLALHIESGVQFFSKPAVFSQQYTEHAHVAGGEPYILYIPIP